MSTSPPSPPFPLQIPSVISFSVFVFRAVLFAFPVRFNVVWNIECEAASHPAVQPTLKNKQAWYEHTGALSQFPSHSRAIFCVLFLFCHSLGPMLYHNTQPTKLAIPSTRRTGGTPYITPSLLFLSIWNGLMQNKIPEKASIFENFVCDAVKLYRWLNSSTLSIYLLYRHCIL